MTLFHWLVLGSCVCLLITGFVHSVFGERLLLQPLFKYRGNKVLENELARFVLRFAWHLMTLMLVVLAVFIYFAAFGGVDLSRLIIGGIGWSFLIAGLYDLVMSRARHIGWPLITLSGLFALLAIYAV